MNASNIASRITLTFIDTTIQATPEIEGETPTGDLLIMDNLTTLPLAKVVSITSFFYGFGYIYFTQLDTMREKAIQFCPSSTNK